VILADAGRAVDLRRSGVIAVPKWRARELSNAASCTGNLTVDNVMFK
jgi:hypothetical protein